MHGALVVGEELDLDVAGALDILLEIDTGVPECLAGLRRSRLQRPRQVLRTPDHPHALATPAGGGLDQHRVADLQGTRPSHRGVGHRERESGDDGDTSGLHPPPRLGLVSHGGDGRGGRSDKDQAGLGDRLGEGGAFGQEAVARMHRPGTARPGGVEQAVDPEIALARRRRADGHGEIGGADVRRQAIRLRVHRHRLEPLLVAGADDAQGDFASVRDEDAAERGHRSGRGGSRQRPQASRGRAPSGASSETQRRGLYRAAS